MRQIEFKGRIRSLTWASRNCKPPSHRKNIIQHTLKSVCFLCSVCQLLAIRPYTQYNTMLAFMSRKDVIFSGYSVIFSLFWLHPKGTKSSTSRPKAKRPIGTHFYKQGYENNGGVNSPLNTKCNISCVGNKFKHRGQHIQLLTVISLVQLHKKNSNVAIKAFFHNNFPYITNFRTRNSPPQPNLEIKNFTMYLLDNAIYFIFLIFTVHVNA